MENIYFWRPVSIVCRYCCRWCTYSLMLGYHSDRFKFLYLHLIITLMSFVDTNHSYCKNKPIWDILFTLTIYEWQERYVHLTHFYLCICKYSPFTLVLYTNTHEFIIGKQPALSLDIRPIPTIDNAIGSSVCRQSIEDVFIVYKCIT